MFRFVFKKIKSKKWMSLCIILGVALLVAVCSSHFIFKAGAEDDIIARKFSDYIQENNVFPGTANKVFATSNLSYEHVSDIRSYCEGYEKKWTDYLELPKLTRQFGVTASTSSFNRISARVSYLEDISEHSTVVDGVGLENAGKYDCLISEATMDIFKLYVGDTIEMSRKKSEKVITFNIVGIIRKSDDTDNYWCDDLKDYDRCIFVSEEAMDEFLAEMGEVKLTAYFHTLYDYSKIDHTNALNLLDWLGQIKNQDGTFSTPLIGIIKECKADMKKVSTLLYVLELPIIVLLLIFIYMISSTMALREEGEIAVLRSRGIKRRKIVGLYILQSVMLSVVAGAIGLGLGIVLCRFAASAKSFLVFTDKNVDSYSFSVDALWGVLVGVCIAIICMIIPVILKSGLTIVKQKAESGQNNKKPLWEKLFVDVLLAGVSIYLLVNYNKQLDSITQGIVNNKDLDPAIFLNSSLFIFAIGLLFVRIIGYLIVGFFKLFKNRFNAWSFAAVINLRRTYRNQSFIAVFIIMTIGNSIFNANLARSINVTTEERTLYNVGCDLRIREVFKSHKVETEKEQVSSYYYDEPFYGKYLEAKEKGIITDSTRVTVEKAASVFVNNVAYTDTVLYAINTKEFGEIATFDSDITEEHWFNALNALAASTNGVIIDSDFAKDNDLQIGSRISYSLMNPELQYEGKIFVNVVAILDAFPAFEKYVYEKGSEELVVEKKQSLFVVNYAQLVSELGVRPYEVWVKTDGKDEQRILDYVSENSKLLYHKSLSEDLAEQNSSAMIQITNGLFSINFIISIAICITGFLVYWIMTIRSRELIFGVYRAMGIKEREISRMLLLEQLVCSVSAGAAGAFIGVVASKLFISLISIAYLPYKHVIAVKKISEMSDMLIIAAGVGVMFVSCLLIITRIVKKLRISEALKLGED